VYHHVIVGVEVPCDGVEEASTPCLQWSPQPTSELIMAYVGSSVTFKCRTRGRPPPHIVWLKNGRAFDYRPFDGVIT
jgi:hypothetical protein